ncbi:hypothetical protein GCM10028895_15420 [Pontibacter rugosus]
MKKLLFAFSLLLSTAIYCCTPDAPLSPSEKAKLHLLSELDTLQHIAENELLRLATTGSEDSIRLAFHRTRQAYKQVELFTEYYAPTVSKELNGAPLPEIEVEETTVFEPSGLQVIEEHLYPSFEEQNREVLIQEAKKFLSLTGRARTILEGTEFTDAHILNACRQEVFRIIVLGISGFDTPLTATGVKEAATALQSVQEVLAFFGNNEQLQTLLQKAIAYTAQSASFDHFDRMAFITQFANPITAEITGWQKQLNVAPLQCP